MAKPWDDLPLVEDRQTLETYGVPDPAVRDKVLDRLDGVHVAFIGASPLVIVSTSTSDGRCDSSPKGDPPGFVKVLDPTTLVVPERGGNNRMDGFHNILENPYAGLLFVIPGRPDTLRVNGEVRIVTNGDFFDDLEIRGHRPPLALMMRVEEVFFHCPKAFMRSKTWKPQTWDPDAVPSYAELAKLLWRRGDDPTEVDAYYSAEHYEKLLYSGGTRA
ncbi:MSMEG_1061 family FMN-dependent PPOX-type flavoprotein [Cumulibacter manganitolerans]|uniref:MSMEG_1061 family FMN-dependent PPOX-type flavoprotein n=1 Tax=Cumulibacter manganitolerans TaxID=1884992 RepID=UPI001297B986|nr:MSMEG_1061 family FMN-dependent PPOX-type flavoprotein [Cumulibacter manganitolerans]